MKEDDAGNDSVFSVSTSVSRQTMRPADGHVENKANIFDEEEEEEDEQDDDEHVAWEEQE